jgi:uncharacterized protein YbjT (DUF2867 family)
MLLITGATGHIGRELVPMLEAADAAIRVLVRDPRRADDFPASVDRAVGDLGDPDTLTAALDGVDRVFLLVPGIDHAPVHNVLAAARRARVERIVYLSSYAVGVNPMPAMGQWHHQREEMIKASAISVTTLRPCGFMTNVLDWLVTLHSDGCVFDPVGPGRAALIDPADIAAVAATTLTDDCHAGRTYTLTGDEPLTVREQARILEGAAGIKIPVREVSTPEEAIRFRYPHGAPPALAAALAEGLRLMRADTTGLTTTDVREVLGRPPHTFAEWCARNAHLFRASLTNPA